MSISVVIPAYNASKYLAETLASALAQTLPADEILVVDDGSADDTADIAESFGAPVRVIRKSRSNQATARNAGIEAATSEWIALLDADDLWMPNKLARQMEELHARPNADLCYTGRVEFSMEAEGRKVHRTITGEPTTQIRASVLRRCTFLPSSTVIRRSRLLEVGGFNDDPAYAEDWEMWVRLSQAGIEFASCPEPLLLYRLHPHNDSADGLRYFLKNQRVFRDRILPQLTGMSRVEHINRFYAENQGFAARRLWGRRDRRCIPFQAKAILHLPFGNPYRYRFLARMIVTLLRGGFAKPEAQGPR